ncbi:MAG: rhodanese-like domain-containing protein [Akkermansiaceae bacterium]|nr:rhodanese-like domain-containing protein [Akkermansiaceae bacterium]
MDMKASTLQQEQKEGRVQVLDVRSGSEWRAGHIAGAEHLPLAELEGGRAPSSAEPGNVLVLVCQSGVRAAKAQLVLKERGIEAEVLEGGMNAWAAAGLPQEQEEGRHGISLMRQVQLIIGSVNLIGVAAGLSLSPWWLVVPVLTGIGLLVAGITGTCGLALLLARMPWNR